VEKWVSRISKESLSRGKGKEKGGRDITTLTVTSLESLARTSPGVRKRKETFERKKVCTRKGGQPANYMGKERDTPVIIQEC